MMSGVSTCDAQLLRPPSSPSPRPHSPPRLPRLLDARRAQPRHVFLVQVVHLSMYSLSRAPCSCLCQCVICCVCCVFGRRSSSSSAAKVLVLAREVGAAQSGQRRQTGRSVNPAPNYQTISEACGRRANRASPLRGAPRGGWHPGTPEHEAGGLQASYEPFPPSSPLPFKKHKRRRRRG